MSLEAEGVKAGSASDPKNVRYYRSKYAHKLKRSDTYDAFALEP